MKLFIGQDTSKKDDVFINASRAHSILICGKRGTGKSYSMGDIVEEVHTETENVVTLVIDPMGIYWTMAEENRKQEDLLWDYGLTPQRFPVNLLVPGDPEQRFGLEVLREMERRGLDVSSLRLNPSDISPDGWCDLFELSINKPMGITLYRSIRELNKEKDSFYIKDILDKINLDSGANERTREALVNRINMAQDWDIFADTYQDIWKTLDEDRINILDLSVIEPGRYSLRNLVVDVLCRDLFRRRVKARRREELKLTIDVPKVWLFIDEAHNFVPSSGKTLSKDVLTRWVKEGRQPGLSMAVASQQPSAIDHEILSQCNLILCHKITTREDVSSLNKLSQDYMGSELKTYVKNIDNVGEAVYVNDDEETVKMVRMRPRKSAHGGGEA